MRHQALRTLRRPARPGAEANVNKLLWAPWHQQLGELAMDVRGPSATARRTASATARRQTLFLFTRADTIYGGRNEIQRNVIAERLLELPRGQ